MESNVKDVTCKKCNGVINTSPNNQKSAICNSCSKKNKVIMAGVLTLIGVLGVSGFYYMNSNESFNGYDGVKVGNNQVSQQSVLIADNDSVPLSSSQIEGVGNVITDLESFKREVQSTKLTPIIGANFELNSSKLSTSSENLLENYVNVFKNKSKSDKLIIEGYTCDLGSDDLNDRLSKNRAEIVKSFFLNRGISEEQILIKWFGKTKFDMTKNREQQRITLVKIES